MILHIKVSCRMYMQGSASDLGNIFKAIHSAMLPTHNLRFKINAFVMQYILWPYCTLKIVLKMQVW